MHQYTKNCKRPFSFPGAHQEKLLFALFGSSETHNSEFKLEETESSFMLPCLLLCTPRTSAVASSHSRAALHPLLVQGKGQARATCSRGRCSCLQQGLELYDPRGCFQPKPFYDSRFYRALHRTQKDGLTALKRHRKE